jgi:hypothetical protein
MSSTSPTVDVADGAIKSDIVDNNIHYFGRPFSQPNKAAVVRDPDTRMYGGESGNPSGA